MIRNLLARLVVFGTASAAGPTPLACQPNAEQPMLPVFHVIGNVTKNTDNSIKLEPINGGEPNRVIGAERDGTTVFFANTHRNKQSVQLNLKTEEGVEAALRLAESCDVMI